MKHRNHPTLSILAIIAARNEVVYLKILIPYLLEQNIDVAVIDNESSDETGNFIARFGDKITYDKISYDGYFDLERQLIRKRELAANSNARWIIHNDADEIMHDSTGWGGLRSAIEEAEYSQCNAIDFNELVMLPGNPAIDDILVNNINFYYFNPPKRGKMSAYANTPDLSNLRTGGHNLDGCLRLFDKPMFLRHYIVRSQEHAFEKYLDRRFSAREIKNGWHKNRTGISKKSLVIPTDHRNLRRFPKKFDASEVLRHPLACHYWEW